jgi:hypothetical protein
MGSVAIGRDGAGRSRDWVVEALRWRGKDEEDHHSKNLRRNIEVGRIKFNEEARRGKIFVRRRVIGERESDALFAELVDDGRAGT